jgi:hypothetical protein
MRFKLGATGFASVRKVEGSQPKTHSGVPTAENSEQANSNLSVHPRAAVFRQKHWRSQWHPKQATLRVENTF